ncbi:MAG: serine/threonine protein kinase, partial [Nostoc sp.]
MTLCINPHCPRPQNSENILFCQACGSELLLEGRYRVTRQLGAGGFAKTFEVNHANTLKVLKVLMLDDAKAVSLFQQEAQVLSHLNHPGIPKGDGYFTFSPKNSQAPLHCLVMEKIEGLDLYQYMEQRGNRPINEKLALLWLTQLATILHEVHQQNFFHRDIKPPNIMLKADGHLALIDFGTAREVTRTYHQKAAGQNITGIFSPGYTPLEQAN